MNVVLYGPRNARWCMTEWPERRVRRTRNEIFIGPNSVRWENDGLTILVDDRAATLPFQIKGQIRVHPEFMTHHDIALDAQERHRWWPIAPRARVEVAMSRPGVRWDGSGYFDTNSGSEPLEQGFSIWNWSRAHSHDGAALLYDAIRRDGTRQTHAVRFDGTGESECLETPGPSALAPTLIWRMPRGTYSDAPGAVRVLKTLEDTPFYSRSVLETELFGERMTAMHESLCLNRFKSGWVQKLLPYRMRRIT